MYIHEKQKSEFKAKHKNMDNTVATIRIHFVNMSCILKLQDDIFKNESLIL